MTPLDELRADAVGDAFGALLARTVLAVGVSRNFPPPSGSTWTADSVNEVAASFLTDGRTAKRLDWLLLRCGDDRAFERALQTMVHNFLRDLGRETELGRLVVRINRALRESDRFERAEGNFWRLADGPVEPSETDTEALAAAVAAVPISVQQWSPSANRRSPFADRRSIDAMLAAAFEAADGSLRAADLARAIAPSVGTVAYGITTVELDSGRHSEALAPGGSIDQLGDDVANRYRALEVLEMLSDRQRVSLAHADLNVRQLAPLLGLGHTQAAVVRKRAIAVLKSTLAHESGGQEVAEMVLEACKIWLHERTNSGDSTFVRA